LSPVKAATGGLSLKQINTIQLWVTLYWEYILWFPVQFAKKNMHEFLEDEKFHESERLVQFEVVEKLPRVYVFLNCTRNHIITY
jgi:hypothetical protein